MNSSEGRKRKKKGFAPERISFFFFVILTLDFNCLSAKDYLSLLALDVDELTSKYPNRRIDLSTGRTAKRQEERERDGR